MGLRRAAVIGWTALVALAVALAEAPGARAAAASAPGAAAHRGVWHTRLRTGDIATTAASHGPRARRLSEEPYRDGFRLFGQPLGRQAASAIGAASPLDAYQQFYLQLPKGLSVQQEAAALKQLEALRGVTVGFVPDNSWHVLLPSDAVDAARAALPHTRLVPIGTREKVAPEWHAIHSVLQDPAAAKELLAGTSVSRLLRGNTTEYIGALEVEATPGGKPRVHVRVWFPRLSPTGAAAVGFNATGASPNPTPDFAPHYAAALRRVVRDAATERAAGKAPAGQQQQQAQQEEGEELEAQHLAAMVQLGKGAASLAGAANKAGAAKDSCAPAVTSGYFTMDVSVCVEDLGPVLRWLAKRPMVYWLAPRMKHSWDNLAAGVVVQGSPLAARVQEISEADGAGLHPLWDAGLRGEGQIVGIGDSGVDMDSCYFYDPKVPFAPEVDDSTGIAIWKNPNHRKVVQYLGLADAQDAVGHGSHTAGTVAGWRYNGDGPDAATGIAPGARLAVIDMSRGRQGYVAAPDDLSDGYFKPSYQAGARIHSDSWGSDVIVYDTSAASLDLWLWEHPDFVSVFAAGNYGAEEEYKTTVTSPATSKNAIAVGATLSIGMPGGDRTSADVHSMVINILVNGRPAQKIVRRAVQAAFGGPVPRGKALQVTAAAPADACAEVSPVPAGSVLLVKRGGCYFSAKLANAAAAGASGVVLTNDKQEGYFQMEAQDDGGGGSGGIFMVGVPLSTGRHIWELLANSTATTITATFGEPPSGLPDYEHLASFSSYGPTADGRIKPDIVAPGTLLSAKSDGVLSGRVDDCATKRSQGTSMAAPVVTGSVTLIRQYFTDGFYPTGTKVPDNGFKPSGPLIKAALLGGASNMLGNTANGLPLEPAPSFKQGFGRVNLTRALPMKESGWRMQAVDMAPISQGETHRYCITATGGLLSITLVWYDYPGSPSSGRSVLVNDLDLEVRAAGLAGALLHGNGFADDMNTVERVTAEDFPAGNVQISVIAKRIPAVVGSQKYALLVQGRFAGVLASKQNPDADAAAAAGAGGANGACVLTVPVIDRAAAPKGLTKDRTVRLPFSTKAGSTPAAGFECKLDGKAPAGAGAANAEAAAAVKAAAHDWKECSSPTAYELPDGTFTFEVRAAGEQVTDTLTFTVDGTPPTLQLTSSIREPASASANATLAFGAADESKVSYECLLTFSAAPGGPAKPEFQVRATYGSAAKQYGRMAGAPRGAAAPPLGEWAPCAGPLTLWGLSQGDWSFAVRASDAAGNASPPAVAKWQTRYEPGKQYARVSGGSFGLVNARDLSFEVAGFDGGADGGAAAPAAAPELEWTFMKAGTPAVPEGTKWNAGAEAAFTVPVDGDFVFLARRAGDEAPVDGAWPETWGVMAVSVDTAPPNVTVSQRPPALQSSPDVTVRFAAAAPGDAADFECRWLHGDAAAPDPAAATPPFGPCNAGEGANGAPAAPPPGAASANVTEGFWLFQVRATDAAGNLGPPANVAFRTDLTPPVLESIEYPNATNAGFATVAFKLGDGAGGSGVANVSCRVALAAAAGAGDAGGAVSDAKPPAGAREADGEWFTGCKSPVSFLLPKDGRYQFSLIAADAAGLQLGPKDFTIVRDTAPPAMKIASAAPPPGVKLPRRVSIDLAGRDSSSGVAAAEAMLNEAKDPEVKDPMSVEAGGGGSRAGSNRERRRRARSRLLRRLLADPAAAAQQLGHAYVHGTNAPVVLGTWLRSNDPTKITFEDLPSGAYTLQARGIDAAGNVSPPTEPVRFDVDASIRLPEEEAALRAQRLKLGVGLGLGLGGAALLAAAIVGAVRWRKGAGARRAAREREAEARRQQFQQWAAYDAAARAAAGRPLPPPVGYPASQPWLGQQQVVSNGTPGWAALGWAAPGGAAAAGATGATAGSGRAAEIDQGLLDMLAQRDAEDARVKAAMAASVEEEQLRKAIALSLGDAPPAARGANGSGSSGPDAMVDVVLSPRGGGRSAAATRPPQQQRQQQRAPRGGGWGWFGGAR